MSSPKGYKVGILGLASLVFWGFSLWLFHLQPGQAQPLSDNEKFKAALAVLFGVLSLCVALATGIRCMALAWPAWKGLDSGDKIIAVLSSCVTVGTSIWLIIELVI